MRNAKRLHVDIDEQAARRSRQRSRSTPRIANNRLRWVRDFATSRSDGRVTLEVAQAALKMAGIDPAGLDDQDRRYLQTLIRVFGGGPAGVEAIAHTMNTSADTLTDEVEPFLLRSELVVRTPRGTGRDGPGFPTLGFGRTAAIDAMIVSDAARVPAHSAANPTLAPRA